MSEKLKPCPFCGGEAVIKFLSSCGYYAECNSIAIIDCAISPSTTFFDTKEEAIEAWNRRAENE